MDSWNAWSYEVFGQAELGDTRRTARLVRMAAQAGRRPSGRMSDVFQDDADRQGAYDFVESKHVCAESIRQSVTAATAQSCGDYPWVFVPLDATSVKLWDGTGGKDFGAIGTYRSKATGLKLYNAVALDTTGAPIGLLGQVWWNRPRSNPHLRRPSYRRATPDKETKYLLQCITEVCQTLQRRAPGTLAWFQLDRGCDAQTVLQLLHDSGHWFTIRAHSDRRIVTNERCPRWLKKTVRHHPVLGYLTLELPERTDRPARNVRLAVRTAVLTLRLRDKRTKRQAPLPINVVSVREVGCRARKAIEWLLLTNRPVATLENACEVVGGYTLRWRIEEFHKTFKTGACNAEQSQLHSSERFIRWATILSAVAARIERLKFLARTKPEEPATIELEPDEISALVLLKSRRKKQNELVPDNPTIAQATLWIAQLGGYTGKSSGGPPGSITIARGLEMLNPAVEMLRALRPSRKMR